MVASDSGLRAEWLDESLLLKKKKQQTNSKQMLDYLSEPLFLGLVFNFSPSFCLPDIPSFVHSGFPNQDPCNKNMHWEERQIWVKSNCDGLFSFPKPLIVQFSSVAQSCPTLCDLMNRSTPGLPVHHHLPEFTQTRVHWVRDAIQPSHPLSSPSPAPNPSQHHSLFQWVNSSHEVAKVLELQL